MGCVTTLDWMTGGVVGFDSVQAVMEKAARAAMILFFVEGMAGGGTFLEGLTSSPPGPQSERRAIGQVGVAAGDFTSVWLESHVGREVR